MAPHLISPHLNHFATTQAFKLSKAKVHVCSDLVLCLGTVLGWRSSSKTAPGSLSTGSPASRTRERERAQCAVWPA